MSEDKKPIIEPVWFCREGRDGWRLLYCPEPPDKCETKLHGTNLCGANASAAVRAGDAEPDSRCHPCDARPGVVLDGKTLAEIIEWLKKTNYAIAHPEEAGKLAALGK